MPISSRSVVSSAVVLLGIGFAALLAIVATTLWLGERANTYFDQTVAIRAQRQSIVNLRQALYAAESSQRGFLVLGNEIYLAPYDLAKTEAERQVADAKRLFAPLNDANADAVARLADVVDEKIKEMDQSVALMRARQPDEALTLFRSNRGKALMDEANVYFASLIQFGDDSLARGVREQTENASWQRLVSSLGAIVIVLVVTGAITVIYRYTRELRAVRDEVTALNSDLEARVSERTQDLVVARDRATALLSEMNHRLANSLALVSSLVGLQAKSVKDDIARQALLETQDRIVAISLVHKRLYSSNQVGVVQLEDYLSGLLEHLKTSLRSEGQGVTLDYDIAPSSLATDASINLGVVVTEWVTNAFKYAYPQGSGTIRVRVEKSEDSRLQLVVEDDGVGRAEGAPAKGTGLGTRIVSAMASSLKGTIEYRDRKPGMSAHLTFPAAA